MTVYPAKDRKGRHTGMWVADVQQDAGLARIRAGTYEEACRAERLLKAGHSPASCMGQIAERLDAVPPPPLASYTLALLAVDARQRLVGHKDEEQSARRLVEMVKLVGPSLDIRDLRHAHLERAAKALLASGRSAKTTNRYMAAISKALKWALLNDLLDRVPPRPWQKEGAGRIHHVPVEFDNRLLQWMHDHDRGRQALVYEVLVSTGLRIGELLALRPHEVDPEWLRLATSKNGDVRDAPIAPEVSQVLRALIASGAMPSYETIRATFVEAGEAVGLPFRLTPHVLRHSAATRLNAAGVTTATVKAFMGHKSVQTTLLYAHVSGDALKTAAKVLRPPRGPDEEPEAA